MTSARHSRLLQFTGLLLSALVWLANNGNPPNGKTGAPFDGTCAEGTCHGTSNTNGYDGDVTVDGLPATIQANTVYPLSITMTPTAGSPTKGGFQIVVVDGSANNAGNLAAGNAQSGTETMAGREYLEHRGGKTFGGGPITWTFNWTSPAGGVAGNTIKVYYIGNFTNGNGQSSGDYPKAFVDTYAFEGPPPVTATITASTNVLCNGGNTGSATVEGGGGTPPYTYHWSNNQTTATAVNLVANTYTVTVTGSSGSGTATTSVVITQPPALGLSASVAGVITCAQTTVTGTATPSGGTPGYDINWSNGQNGNTAVFDAPGSYTVTATDANGCTKIASVTVNQNIAPPIATVAPGGTLDCMVTQLGLSGIGSSTGANYTYHWTTVGGNIVSGANTLTPTINACGAYTLVVTNNTNGCTSSASTSVNCLIDPPNISVGNNGPLTCTLLNATLNGSSNTSGVTFTWTGPNGYFSMDPNPTTNAPGTYTLVVSNPANGCTSSAVTNVNQNIVPPSDTANATGTLTCLVDSVHIFMSTNIQNATYLWSGPNGFTSHQKRDTIGAPGSYIGIVTNPVNGCKSRDTILVVQNTAPPGATAATSGALTCTNSAVQLTGGPSGQNTYAWTGPGNFNSIQQNPTANTAGTYTIVVMSGANGCTSSASVTVQQNIAPPVSVIAAPGTLNCNNNTIQLNASSGSSQGANFSYQWTTTNGVIVSGGNTLTPIVGAAGTYTLVITNTDNGCTSSASTTVVQHAPVLATLATVTNVSCNGGSNGAASVNAGGGNGVYSYLWSNGATTSSISGLPAGSYGVSITDGEGCSAAATAVIAQPDPLQSNASATGETSLGAHNGTATAAPTGGTPGYSYSWSNGGTTATITGLAPGSYTVSVTDQNGCSVVQTVTVNAFGCSLAANISSTNATCNGANNGTASVTLSGATNPVTFHWSNGAITQNVGSLQPGTYTVSVVDGNNCPAVLNTTINEPTVVSANASATGETALGAHDGTATAAPTGGTGNYTYAWSNGGTTATITGLAAGVYTVSVTDTNNCSAVQTVSVSAFNCALSASISGANVSCFGKNDGLATIALNGGQLPYTYHWSNGATTATASNLAAGTYTVNATDDAGCLASETITITEPQELTAEVTAIQNVVCAFEHTGSVTIDAAGGTPPYSISGGLGNLGVGAHTATVTDANGCNTSVTFNIVATDSEAPVISCPSNIYFCGADFVNYPAPTATDNCGQLAGPIVLVSGQPSGSVFNDGATVQVYRATDLNGNSSTCSFSVVVYPIPDILINSTNDDHNGQSVGSIAVTAVGGSGSYFYIWNRNGQFFSNSEDLSGLNAGSYTLTITDANGCTSALAPIVINNTVGTFEPGQSGSIRLYPNPVFASFQLQIIDLDVVAGTIMDTRGRIVYKLQPKEWENNVSVEGLSTGVYFLRLSTESGQVLTLKFVKSE